MTRGLLQVPGFFRCKYHKVFTVSVDFWNDLPRRKTGVEKVCVGYLVLGLASGLEAFSREPPCDSIGALAVRQTPETSGMAREFLSYYPLLPSRYLRDPSTISVNRKRWNSLSTDDFGQCYQVYTAVGCPRTAPSSLRAKISRNFRLSRVKPTCLTTV